MTNASQSYFGRDLWTIDEVADYCRVPVETIRTWRASGRLTALKPGKRLLFRKAAVLAFLKGLEPRRG